MLLPLFVILTLITIIAKGENDFITKVSNFTYENEYHKITYNGEIKDDAPNGFGIGLGFSKVFPNIEFSYEGEWKDGLQEGYGEVTYPGKDYYYKGNWKHGDWLGIGEAKSPDWPSDDPVKFKPIKDQNFSYDAIKMNKNFMVPLSNFVYNGQSTDGLPNGYGEAMEFKNGSMYAKYYGYWRNGHPHAYGILEASADTIYRGSWYKGLWSNGFTFGSRSEYKYPGGNTIFKGIFDFNGPVYGELNYYQVGQKYTGMMSDFKENGLGIHVVGNGQTYIGPKIDGRFDTTGNTNGTYIYQNGKVYKGQYKNGLAIGKHEVKLVNGTVTEACTKSNNPYKWNFVEC